MQELERTYGCRSAVATLRRVLLRPPQAPELRAWREYGWRDEPDPGAIADEHAEFCTLLTDAGAEVVLGDEPVPGDPDAIYAYDPVLVAPGGAILLRPGKEGRRREPEALAPALETAGVPLLARLEAPALADGGDMFWLDERTLLVGRGYRTNDAGIAALRTLLPEVDVLAFDLPHRRGPGEVLHLLSLISPLDSDLAVGFAPLLPVRLMELLAERGIRLIDVPEDELETMGPNVLALAPRVALLLARNVETRRLVEHAGVDVLTYEGRELSKGDGGPTCLTQPLLRD